MQRPGESLLSTRNRPFEFFLLPVFFSPRRCVLTYKHYCWVFEKSIYSDAGDASSVNLKNKNGNDSIFFFFFVSYYLQLSRTISQSPPRLWSLARIRVLTSVDLRYSRIPFFLSPTLYHLIYILFYISIWMTSLSQTRNELQHKSLGNDYLTQDHF